MTTDNRAHSSVTSRSNPSLTVHQDNPSHLRHGCPEVGREHTLYEDVDRLVCLSCGRHRYFYGSWSGTASLMEQVWS